MIDKCYLVAFAASHWYVAIGFVISYMLFVRFGSKIMANQEVNYIP